tara:strand:+ start:252 stop:509 length:258 start_codon:yes stop_codon:yes gene_type:complete
MKGTVEVNQRRLCITNQRDHFTQAECGVHRILVIDQPAVEAAGSILEYRRRVLHRGPVENKIHLIAVAIGNDIRVAELVSRVKNA